MNEQIKVSIFFQSITYIYVYLFLIITTFHLQSEILASLQLEIICVFMIWFCALVDVFFPDRNQFLRSRLFLKTSVLALIGILIPMISSLANEDYLKVIFNGEYRSYFKIMIISPLLLFYFDDKVKINQLIHIVLIFFTLLGVIFIYRFIILNETRDYDLRPLLQIKNGDPNFLSMYFTTCIPLAIYRLRQMERLGGRVFYTMLAAFFLLCTIMNQSRMGIIALFIIVFMLLMLLKWKIRMDLFFISALVIFALGVSYAGKIYIRFINFFDTSNLDRVKTMWAGFRTFYEAPWFGVGWNKSSLYYYHFADYPSFQSLSSPYEVHNTPLKIASETGLIGLFFYLTVLSSGLLSIFKNLKIEREVAIMNLCILISLGLNSITISTGYKDLYIFLLTLVFILNGVRHHSHVLSTRG